MTTTRDAQGIWFIEGGTLYEVMEAMGYAVAQDRLWQMDIFRRQGRGTLSALLGSSQIPNDVFLRTISYTDDELTGFFDELSPDAQTLVTGYTDGINRRIGEFYAGAWLPMPYEYWLLGLQSVLRGPGLPVLPQTFSVNDTLAWLVLLQRNFDPEGRPGDVGQLDNATMVQTLIAAYGGIDPMLPLAMFSDLRWINDPSALTYIPSGSKSAVDQSLDPALAARFAAMPSLAAATERIRATTLGYHEQMQRLNAEVKMGSYAWAVSADKTASGNPIVYSGPQMGFTVPSIVAEGSIRGGGLEISGMTVPGIPFLIIGRTPAPRVVDAGRSRPHRRLLSSRRRRPSTRSRGWRRSRSSAPPMSRFPSGTAHTVPSSSPCRGIRPPTRNPPLSSPGPTPTGDARSSRSRPS